jgi:hypothetical protein
MRLLLLFLLVAAASLARATMHCETQAGSVSALRATCLADLGCRAFFGKKPASEFARLVTQRLHLVRDWDSALAGTQSAFHGDDDVRHHFWPQSWRNDTPTLLAFGALPAELPDAVGASLLEPDCSLLAANLAHPTTSSLPPIELRDAVHQLLLYAVFLSDERQCNPESEVLVLNPDTGEPHCMLAANHVCASSTGIDNTLTIATISMAAGLVGLAVLVLVGLGSYAFYKLRELPSAESRLVSLEKVTL